MMTPRTRATLQVGDKGSFTKTITEKDVFEFADATGDFNPLHIDEEYAKRTVFGHRIAHGILTAGIISTVLGGEIPGLGTIFVEMHIKFLKPVYFVVPEKSSRSRYLLDEMRRSGGYTLQETQEVWVETLQNGNGFHATQTAKARRV